MRDSVLALGAHDVDRQAFPHPAVVASALGRRSPARARAGCGGRGSVQLHARRRSRSGRRDRVVRKLESSSPEETERVAARLAERLVPGDVVTVSGELGTGKTTFVRGACRALGVTEPVTSPTFTIGHRYRGEVDVSHLDLYRFERVSPEEWGDLEPYFREAIVFVEWPEAARGALPPVRARVRLRHLSPSERAVDVEADAAIGDALRG
ncbi:MAG: tRNA (adenosine(37)-N6)-threonylcarbamoyltransferase complex ATPase subunit type 1 TsaE [Thermoleophilia bacterium]|nr:tRNA (adenosine(37)-N6)-threonylcarbamoyltransferase complex ATPase subunit type 1 TsaE [Thermoleophilia bacterium]